LGFLGVKKKKNKKKKTTTRWHEKEREKKTEGNGVNRCEARGGH